MTTSPISTNVEVENIPDALRDLDRWILWKPVWDGKKWQKIPVRVGGGPASTTNPSTWSTFDQVNLAWRLAPEHGIGFVLAADDGLVGIDLDKCRDGDSGEFQPWAQEIIEKFATYTEISPSGTGARLFIAGSIPAEVLNGTRGRRVGGIEVYSGDHYLTVTGNHLPDAPITVEHRQQELTEFCLWTFKTAGEPAPDVDFAEIELTDARRVEVLNDSLFHGAYTRQSLYHGQKGNTDSDYDFSLAIHGFSLGWSPSEIVGLLRASRAEYGRHPEKIDRASYIRPTLARAKAKAEKRRGKTDKEVFGRVPGMAPNDNWPEPKPITAALHPVPALDPEALLPDALRGWVMDEADRMPCPPDFIAAATLVALGSVIGARCAIKPKARDPWLIVPNLWGGIVGLPSAKKSPAISAGLKPLDRLIALAIKEHQAAIESYEAEKLVFEARADALQAEIKKNAKSSNGSNGSALSGVVANFQAHRKAAPEAPCLRRYKSNDSTIEKLGELLRENPAGLLVLRDELVGLIASWDRVGREGERAFYLEAWNGTEGFDTDRIGRGSIFIPNLCVSLFGGIQPDKLVAYLEQAAHALANDGMLQRFQLLVYPDHRAWEWRDRMPARDARDCAFDVFDKLAEFDPTTWGALPADDFSKFPFFRFDEAAQEIFIEWSTNLHRERLPAEDNPIIAQHLVKFDKLFPAVSLILHLVDCVATGSAGPVTAESALRAAAWCEYLEAHARRCYGLLVDDGLRAAQALADKVGHVRLVEGFTARDVRRNQWRYLTTDEQVRAALDWLEDEHWLRSEAIGGAGPGTGRRTSRYFINPKTSKPGGSHD